MEATDNFGKSKTKAIEKKEIFGQNKGKLVIIFKMVTNFHLKYRCFEHSNHICIVAVVLVWRPTQLQKHTYIHFLPPVVA